MTVDFSQWNNQQPDKDSIHKVIEILKIYKLIPHINVYIINCHDDPP